MISIPWVEIPARDVERALKFYSAILDFKPVEITDDGTRKTAVLDSGNMEQGKPGVSLNQTRNFEPCDKGTLAYFYIGDDMPAALEKVKAAGGKVIEGKTDMGGAGFYATVLDTEGNLLALYSAK